MCQGFSNFLGFLHHFVLAELATTSIKVIVRDWTYVVDEVAAWFYGKDHVFLQVSRGSQAAQASFLSPRVALKSNTRGISGTLLFHFSAVYISYIF